MPRSDLHLLWSPESEDDFQKIWRWGATRFSPEKADAHLRDIHESVDALRTTPFLGRSRDDLSPSLRSIVVYPTIIFYRVTDESVDIVRLIDGRRNLAAVFSREGGD